MSEENTAVETAPEQTTQEQPVEQQKPDIYERHPGFKDATKEDTLLALEKTMSEAKSRRLQVRELEEKLKSFEEQTKQKELQELEQKQEFEKLYGTLKDETKDYEELKEFKTNYLNQCKEKIDNIKNGLTKAEAELFDLSAKHMPYDEQMAFIEKLVGNRAVSTAVDKATSIARKNDEKPDVKIPAFGNPGGTQNLIMQGLAKLRKN